MDMMKKPDTAVVLTVSDRHLSPDGRPVAMARGYYDSHNLSMVTTGPDTFIDISAKGLDGVDMYCISCKDPGLARCIYMAIRQGAKWLHIVHDPDGKRLLPGLPHYDADGQVVITYRYCAQKLSVDEETGIPAGCLATVQFTGENHTDEWAALSGNGYNRLLRRYYGVTAIQPVETPDGPMPDAVVTEILTPSGEWKVLRPSPHCGLSI